MVEQTYKESFKNDSTKVNVFYFTKLASVCESPMYSKVNRNREKRDEINIKRFTRVLKLAVNAWTKRVGKMRRTILKYKKLLCNKS